MKFHGFTGQRDVLIRFFDTSKNNKQDGETWVNLHENNNVLFQRYYGGFIDYSPNGAPFARAFKFNIERVEFTNEKVDAHPKSLLFGKEQWQLVKVYGTNTNPT